MPWLGCIRYKDIDACEREWTWLHDAASITQLQTFAQAVAPFIGAAADKIAVTETAFVSIPGGSGENEEIHTEMQISLRNTATGKRVGFSLPAPSKQLFDYVNGKYRLKQTHGVQLAQYYQTLTGIPVTFVSGVLTGPF